jgi:hypothetical protein
MPAHAAGARAGSPDFGGASGGKQPPQTAARSSASWRYTSISNSAESDTYSGLLASVAAETGAGGLAEAVAATGSSPSYSDPRSTLRPADHAATAAAAAYGTDTASRQLWSPSKRSQQHVYEPSGGGGNSELTVGAPAGVDAASYAAGERAALMHAFQQALPGQQALGQLFSGACCGQAFSGTCGGGCVAGTAPSCLAAAPLLCLAAANVYRCACWFCAAMPRCLAQLYVSWVIIPACNTSHARCQTLLLHFDVSAQSGSKTLQGLLSWSCCVPSSTKCCPLPSSILSNPHCPSPCSCRRAPLPAGGGGWPVAAAAAGCIQDFRCGGGAADGSSELGKQSNPLAGVVAGPATATTQAWSLLSVLAAVPAPSHNPHTMACVLGHITWLPCCAGCPAAAGHS